VRIAVGSDHAAYRLKTEIISFLETLDHEVLDCGTRSTDPVDYPDIALAVAEKVARGDADRGVIACGTGIGTSIVANKVPGIRAALCHDVFSARATREHNDSNVLCLGARVIGPSLALEILKTWLEGTFERGGRHERRVRRIAAIETEMASRLAGEATRRAGPQSGREAGPE